MVGINVGPTERKVLAMQKNPIAKDLMTRKYRQRVKKNKKKELDKKRLKSMKLLYRLEFLT
ncbi:MAG: hypothetical protein CBB68_06850 [Rhodospirillaceae bacterium TMED8]|nr:MAG: hypothetical protein CBB68_06850 [Rhodospirillaceae bacterium TMED8]|tara:strand:- start:186 stop:368 length:183 start_codon:yes stop_codon:yes gene_type:complete